MFLLFELPWVLWGAWQWCRTRPWAWPFAWILLIPIVTGFWRYGLLGGVVEHDCVPLPPYNPFAQAYECPVEDVLPTLLPGLLNLVAFLWVLSSRRQVQYAALVAGTLGAVRLAVPALIYVASGPAITIGENRVFDTPATLESFVLWLISLAVALVFPLLVKDDQPQEG